MDAALRRAAALALAAVAALACASDGARYQTLRQELARSEPRPTPTVTISSTASPCSSARRWCAACCGATRRCARRRRPGARPWRAIRRRRRSPTRRLGMALGPRSFDAAGIDPAWKADLSQELPFPGKLALRGAVALGEADAAAGDFEAARLQLATVASLLYDDYYLMARTLDVEEHHVALLEELERSALARLEAGEAMLQDPVRAAAELARRRQDRIRFESALRTTAQQLNLLLHRGPDLPLPPPPKEIEPAATPPELDANADADALVAAALGARPELRAARGRIASGEAGVDLARREYFPDFTVMAGWDAFWQEGPLQPSVGLQLNLPLRRERRAAAVEEAAAKLARARSDEDSAADEVRFSVRNALERLREARAGAAAAGDGEPAGGARLRGRRARGLRERRGKLPDPARSGARAAHRRARLREREGRRQPHGCGADPRARPHPGTAVRRNTIVRHQTIVRLGGALAGALLLACSPGGEPAARVEGEALRLEVRLDPADPALRREPHGAARARCGGPARRRCRDRRRGHDAGHGRHAGHGRARTGGAARRGPLRGRLRAQHGRQLARGRARQRSGSRHAGRRRIPDHRPEGAAPGSGRRIAHRRQRSRHEGRGRESTRATT